ncbi:MAG: hypothetical protein QME79_09155 [Bacillota bacterium]|nr:hypothetical protein [Bacillota bacterium]
MRRGIVFLGTLVLLLLAFWAGGWWNGSPRRLAEEPAATVDQDYALALSAADRFLAKAGKEEWRVDELP